MISFWEKEYNSQEFDVTIIGAGFTGLFSAWFILKENPKAKIAVCDISFPPPAASTRNAGFSCFGSPTEILEDLSKETEASVLGRIKMRMNGLEDLKSICGTNEINYTDYGGYEIFTDLEKSLFESTVHQLKTLNQMLLPFTGRNAFEISDNAQHSFKNAIRINFEGQINPFLAWRSLYRKVAAERNVHFVSGKVLTIEPLNEGVSVSTEKGIVKSRKVIVATNGFTKRLLPKTNIVPARAQVLITSPIDNLKLKGSFHKDRGYVYFRNVGNRVLLGGYRNLDVEGEETDAFGLNSIIQQNLESLLRNEILHNRKFKIEHRWSGTMGFGENQEKDFLLEEPIPNVILAVRLGGMGVAISSALAKKAVKKIDRL